MIAKSLLAAFIVSFLPSYISAAPAVTSSPDGRLQVLFEIDSRGVPFYSIEFEKKTVLKSSRLGLDLDGYDFSQNLTLEEVSKPKIIKDKYRMPFGKRKECSCTANRRTFSLKNQNGNEVQIVFQVSNDGVVFRYAFPKSFIKSCTVNKENTAFAFAPTTVSWLHPMQPGKSGWSRTQPSYEENYISGKPVGNPSPTGQGWCFPALFKTSDDIWVLICDSDVDENYCAVRLAGDSNDGVYKVAFPHPEEHRGQIDPARPKITLPFESPWRVLIIGDSLATIVESTLMTDVAKPCKIKNIDFIKPGRAAWSWLRYDDNGTKLDVIESFLDFAAKMKWEYILVDANWDTFIGYEKIADFVKKAKSKNIGVILWYNSNGSWNDAPMGPKDKMHERTVRRAEFARLKKMGVKGVKIDFFGGDKQATMKLYLDTLKDAADYKILVNCHGATIPRGWQRTFPNLVTMEAVKGMEYCTFDQGNANREPQHCCVLPFTRNVISSMDFTPTVIDPNIRGVKLITKPVFELALPVVFESGITHLGLVPDEYKLMPDYVVEFLQNVPTAWDETRFVDGYPGKFVVIARRSGDVWYIAGINGTEQEMDLSLDLNFIPNIENASLFTDGPDRTFVKKTFELAARDKLNIKILPHGGFVASAKCLK
ncbi:MAG: glycoside hydrolase family 97 catalytic domain-containing protein [Phycisphaerae bacterium]|jgi:hypothetical protein